MSLDKSLLYLIKKKRSERAKSVLEDSQLSKSLDTFGATLLRYSAKHGNAKVTKYLLSKGCNKFINARDSKGRTALIKAMQGRHAKVIEILLNAGADPLALDRENKNALQMVCTEDFLTFELRCTFLQGFRRQCSSSQEAADKLIEAGCQLYQAVYSKDAETLECMLQRGLSTKSMISEVNVTALHIAVIMQDVECVKVLLKYGADVGATDVMGFSPLCSVYRYSTEHSDEKVEILRVLLSESGSRAEFSQLKFALMNGNSKAIAAVLSHLSCQGESINNDALHHLTINFNPGIVDELKLYSHKFDVNALNHVGQSALQMAAMNGNVEMVKFLLDHGADVHHMDYPHARTALYYACTRLTPLLENEYLRCIELLLQHGADAQFIAVGTVGEKVTVLDTTIKFGCNEHRIFKSAVAQLALLENRGTPISGPVRVKIGSHRKLQLHYDRCRSILGKEINGNVTILKLLAGSEKNLEMYAGNKDLVLKLKRISHKNMVRCKFPYYFDVLLKRFSKGMQRRRLTDAAARVVCDIFGGRVDQTHVVVGRVNDYLSDRDLWQLCQV